MNDLAPKDRQDLGEAEAAFHRDMARLTPREQSNRAHVIAGGVRSADPLTRALAEQFVAAEKLRDGIVANQEELRQLEADLKNGGYRPHDPDWRGRTLARREDLKAAIEQDHARLLGIAEDPLLRAREEAVEYFRAQDAAAEKARLLQAAVERQEAEQAQADIEALAARVVQGRRMAQGKAAKAGEAQ